MLIGDFMNRLIARLVQYGIDKGLIMEDDRVYCTNQILDIVGRIEYIDETNLEPVEDSAVILNVAIGKSFFNSTESADKIIIGGNEILL